MLKFYHILLLTLVAVFLASAAGIARYAADSCTQSRMYRQLAAQTENFSDDAVSTGNIFLPQYQALYAQNTDLAGWIQIDGTNINYPVMQSKHDPDFYLKHNFEKADSPHGCPYVQANCDLQTPSDNILVYGHNMKDGTMFSDLLQYKRESFWEQHRIIRFDTLTAQAEYTVIRKIHPHMFRHTFVSILLSNPDIGVATVAAEAGHAQPSTTLAIYTQVYHKRQDSIRSQMSETLYKRKTPER